MKRNTLWYREPASQWNEALPVGNGRLGAMVFGGVNVDRIQVNEESLWSGGPHCYDNPEAYSHLQAVRDLVRKGDYDAAQDRAQSLMGMPVNQCAYQPLGDLHLSFGNEPTRAENYRRELDMESGTVRVRYTVGETAYSREIFASFPQQVLVYRLATSGPDPLEFTLRIDSPHANTASVSSDHSVRLSGALGPRDGAHLICEWDGEGLAFEAEARVVLPDGGTLTCGEDALTVSGASSATIILFAATSYRSYENITGDPHGAVQDALKASTEIPYEVLHQNHVEDFAALFSRFDLDLGGDIDSDSSTADRLKNVNDGIEDPVLDAQFVQFGRYLIISGSRPGGWPLNLQGIWNQDTDPPWGSKYTININIQMNYWAAENGNLSECHEPLFDLIRDLSVTGRRTAQTHYRASGWMAHHNTDAWRGAAPVDGSTWGIWPTGGAWFCLHIWEHYQYTLDVSFLSEMFPLMKGAAEFFFDALVETDDGYLITSPSISPEHGHTGGVASERDGPTICEGPAMDQQILRDLFSACAQAAAIVDSEGDFVVKAKETAARLAPDKVGRFGQLQEWQEDWDNPEDTHSHVSHLYGLFPSAQINPTTPDLFEAAEVALEKRQYGRGWPGAWRTCLWARLFDGEKAHTNLQRVMQQLSINLFNGTRVFQIDGNLGATAGCIEMLVQSHLGIIHLLPALPNVWQDGRFSGARVRGGYTVDCEWVDGEMTRARIVADYDGTCSLQYDGHTASFEVNANVPITVDKTLSVQS